MAKLVSNNKPVKLAQILTKLERAYIKEALKECGGNKTEAAALLSMKRTTLAEKLRRMGLSLDKI